MVDVIKDLENGDACFEKVILLEDNTKSYDSMIYEKNKIISLLHEKENIHELDIKAYNITLDKINNDYNKSLLKIKRKNTIITASIGINIVLGTLLYLISIR